MRRLELMITDVRNGTNNREWSTVEGIPQAEFVRHFRDGQRQLHNLIVAQHVTAFVKEVYVDVVGGQESYTVASDAFLAQNIAAAEYSPTGNLTDFRPLSLMTWKERQTVPGYPRGYLPRDGSILLNPIPQGSVSQGLRYTYTYKLPDLDIRHGTVASTVINTGTRVVTSITLANDTTLDPNGFAGQDYVTIIDRNGVILMNGLPVLSWDPVGLVLTADTTYNYAIGETLPVGAYLCFGKNTTTASPLVDLAEDYLMKYCEYQTLKRDSNVDSAEFLEDLKDKAVSIVAAYAGLSQDVEGIPITNTEFGFGDM